VTLGGWTRLWVLVGVLYLIFVCGVGLFLLPTDAGVPQATVYKRMGSTTSKKLLLGYEFAPHGDRKLFTGSEPIETLTDDQLKQLSNDPRFTTDDFLNLTSAELRRMNGIIDGLPAEHLLAKSRRTVTVDVANGQLNFEPDVSSSEKAQASSAYDEALRRELAGQRIRFSAYALLLWIVPWVSVYALGWSVGWVWRGFSRPRRGGEAV
jgi:hypothetical protein